MCSFDNGNQPSKVMIQSNFREWTLEKIEDAFGLQQVRHLPALAQWLAHIYQLTDFERRYLTELQEVYLLGGDDWNEVELENKFISPLIVFAKIDNKRFAYFLERELATVIGEHSLSGKVDGMIASGFRSPKKPYFCLNEYKRQTDPNGDPRGQVLIAMFAAQHLNNGPHPVLGCYIIGKFWAFVCLQGNQYAVSEAYAADGNDIFDIYRIMRGLHHQIEQQLDTPLSVVADESK
jgi:hypothetical protein